jgi:L,D-transpeptidase ErfK/SrfK
MRHSSRWSTGAIVLAGALALAGCSLVSKPWQKEAPPAPPVVVAPPPVPVLPMPVATFRFELERDTDDLVGAVQITTTSKDDTLPDIARRFDIGYEEIVRANPGVDPWLPGANRRIVVPTQFLLPNAPRDGIVINIPAMRIFYYPKRKPGEPMVVYTYPIGVGKVGWNTPEGTTKIVSRERNPTWRPSAGVRKEHLANEDPVPAVVPPGPDNPLGKYKFNLGWPSYLIHGTNKPYGVGLRSSHGCIRLYPEDIEKLFDAAPIGTPVHVVNQPFLFGWHEGRLYVQTYTVLEDDKRQWQQSQPAKLTKIMAARLQKELKTSGAAVDWTAIEGLSKLPRGIPVAVSGTADTMEDTLSAAPLVQNRIPPGSNWDGADDAARDEGSYQQLMSEREPDAAVKATVKTHL